MPFDFKKEFKVYYMPKTRPEPVTVPSMNYLAIRGKGSPTEENGFYKKAVGILNNLSFTIKMSYRGMKLSDGYFDYVVPPLETYWWNDEDNSVANYTERQNYNWIAVIRLPDFVNEEDFVWAVNESGEKKKADYSLVEFLTIEEGLCVQMMHVGSYDSIEKTVAIVDQYVKDKGYEYDFSENRHHHEIFISDPRKVETEKLKTVVRRPVIKKEGK